MKKAKPKPKAQPRKRKPATKATSKKRSASLQSQLETEFSHAVASAKSYVSNPERLRDLVKEAATKASSMPREVFKETWAYFQAMLRLIRSYYRGDYREVSVPTLLLIIAAIIYIVNPLDLIPDWVPGFGFLDDAFILTFAVRRTRQSLDDFMAWETAAPCGVECRNTSNQKQRGIPEDRAALSSSKKSIIDQT
jgi:uncharacterized membrane protein YkvA (DUF1232 family)